VFTSAKSSTPPTTISTRMPTCLATITQDFYPAQ
jgi:hypothetical protein